MQTSRQILTKPTGTAQVIDRSADIETDENPAGARAQSNSLSDRIGVYLSG